VFVGREVYEAAGGTFKFDLFTDEGFLTEPAMLERLAREKLHALAQQVAEDFWRKWARNPIKGIEVMRALRKGPASAFYYGDPLGEMRLVSRAFEI